MSRRFVPGLTVATRDGRVRGAVTDTGYAWRGIPYARPPVGPLRFRRPAPPERWDGVLDATEFSAIAWQGAAPSDGLFAPPARPVCHEDCLTVNVSTPHEPPPETGYPVVVWLHSGGNVVGWGGDAPVRDGEALVERGIAVVTFNYRLGALGFLQLADVLGPAFADAGTAGLLDQVEALGWVRENIGRFGGDPHRVTIYGISAGGKSVANLLSSPAAHGLFQQAIAGSGGGTHVAPPELAQALTLRLLDELGLSPGTADRLQHVAPSELVAAQEAIATGARASWVWRPVLGGALLPRLPSAAIAEGAAAGIPLLIGHNGNEGATFQLWDASAADQAPRVLTELFGERAAEALLRTYCASNLAVLGDERYGIPTVRLADRQAAFAPVWRYRFDACPPSMPRSLKGGHGMDALTIWDRTSQRSDREDQESAALSRGMVDCWSSFVTDGEPVSAGLPLWPRYGPERPTMILDTPPRIEDDPRSVERRAWDAPDWISGTWWDILS